MKSKRTYLLAASLLVMLSAEGCQRKATGQVVAVVNGEEITQQEVNAELGGLKLPQNADKKLVQQQALQRIVERRLVAMAARNDGLDKDQEYLIRQRQMDDGLLVEMLGDRAQRTFRIPDAAAINKFVASRPMVFGQRLIYTVDRVQFPMPADANQLRKFGADHTMDAVVARLNAMGITFNRAPTQMDSAALPPPVMKRIQSLPPGEPFAIPEPGAVSIAVITGSTPSPLTGDGMRPLAVQMMRREAMIEALKQRLKTEKASAKIEYQPGFAPAKSSAPQS